MDAIAGLESLSIDNIYKRDKIECWLQQYKDLFKFFIKDRGDRSSMVITYRKDAGPEFKEFVDKENKINSFLDTYEALNKISTFYIDEMYYEQEIELYHKIKNDVRKLNSWFKFHQIDENNKHKEFVSLFQNVKTLLGYEFKVSYPFTLPINIRLDPKDFKYVLQFLDVLERNSKVVINGIIQEKHDVQVHERRNSQSYKSQSLVLFIDDEHRSELLIRFVHEKVNFLENLEKGQKVRIYTELLGGKDIGNKNEYSIRLLGWDVELLKN